MSCSEAKYENLSGIVFDAETGSPISGVTLTLLQIPKHAKSDDAGAYCFEALEPGDYSIQVQKEGYQRNIIDTSVTVNKKNVEDISMRKIHE
jgi:hypothetical protein